METITRFLANESATDNFGDQLSNLLIPGLIIHLSGDLGAGKTTLVRSILRHLGVTGSIKSPTYSVVEVYVVSKFIVYHLDFYRFQSENEWEALGMRDMLDNEAILLIEWPQMAGVTLAEPDIAITLTPKSAGREVTVTAMTQRGKQQLKQLDYAEKME